MASRAPRKSASRPSRKAPAPPPAATTKGPLPQGVRVRARLYCQGIGDCHLLEFPTEDGKSFWMLIDCGIHLSITGGAAKIDAIVESILSFTKRLDVIVATHEHWDHISGFLTSARKFKEFEVGEIWMAWTENPRDAQARTLDKFKSQALAALQGAQERLSTLKDPGTHLSVIREGVDNILGFFGAKGEQVRNARNSLVALAKDRVRYLEPKNPPATLPKVPDVRVYFLGPPRDPKLLNITERASEMYGLNAMVGWPTACALSAALAASHADSPDQADRAAPFDPNVGVSLSDILAASRSSNRAGLSGRRKRPLDEIASFVRNHYSGTAPTAILRNAPHGSAFLQKEVAPQSWRRIDHDWLSVSADLAMQLDRCTNNTSLVLAFELIDTGRVLLFAADAQVGNWLSWQQTSWKISDTQTVTGPDLLAKTVFYKVGHHGSQNATLKEKGLQEMTHPDLSAFIPTNEKDAKKVKWGQMPFHSILSDLKTRTAGRVIRADDPWIATTHLGIDFKTPSGSVRDVDHQQNLFVALDLA